MPKQPVNRINWGVFALEFVGSLFYLWVLFATTNGNSFANITWNSANIWLPVFYAAAVVSSIALILSSFGNLWKVARSVVFVRASYASLASVIGGFALFALSAGDPVSFVYVIIGFVLSYTGSGFALLEKA